MAEAVTDAVRLLIAAGVRSLEQLETLVFMAQEPGRSWPLADLRADAVIGPQRAREVVDALAAAGLVVCDDGDDPHVRLDEHAPLPALQALRLAHERDRPRVVNAFYAGNLDKLRSFADAFKQRRSD